MDRRKELTDLTVGYIRVRTREKPEMVDYGLILGYLRGMGFEDQEIDPVLISLRDRGVIREDFKSVSSNRKVAVYDLAEAPTPRQTIRPPH